MGEANAAKQRSGGPPGAEVVGQRVSVFWPEEKAWFEGVIKKASAEKGKHFGERGPSFLPHHSLKVQLKQQRGTMLH
jgi:hypothetical protein